MTYNSKTHFKIVVTTRLMDGRVIETESIIKRTPKKRSQ